jgi:hypothetical protein
MELRDLCVWGLDEEYNPLKGYFQKPIENPREFDPKKWAVEICENVFNEKGNISHFEE